MQIGIYKVKNTVNHHIACARPASVKSANFFVYFNGDIIGTVIFSHFVQMLERQFCELGASISISPAEKDLKEIFEQIV